MKKSREWTISRKKKKKKERKKKKKKKNGKTGQED